MKKLLFISQKFGNTGSEKYLYYLISALKKEDYDISLLSIQDGNLLYRINGIKEFSLEIHFKEQRIFLNSFKNKFFRKGDIEERFFLKIVKGIDPDLIYINTLVIPKYLELASKTGHKCILHSHELEQALFHNLYQNDLLVNYPKLIIACSKSNANVIHVLGRKDNVIVLPPAIDLECINPTVERLKIRNNLGIAENDFVWVMSGGTDVNKDPIIFVELAQNIVAKYPHAKFIWLGGNQNEGTGLYAKKLTSTLGLSNYIFWIDHLDSEQYYNYLNICDCFLLTSKRDSFPLVMIENAILGKPILAFNSGGVNEFVNSPEIGIVVKERSIAAMTEAMVNCMVNPFQFNPDLCLARAKDFDINKHIIKWQQLVNSIA